MKINKPEMTYQFWLTLGGMVVTFLFSVITITAKVTRIVTTHETNVDAKLIAHDVEVKTFVRQKIEDDGKLLRDNISETLRSIKTHIERYEEKHYKLELYIRDNYIEVPTFKDALTDIKSLIVEVKEKLDNLTELKLR